MNKFIKNTFLIALAATLFSGCSIHQTQSLPDVGRDYTLGVGDKINVVVYNQDKLSGEFVVDSQGNIALPLLGSIPVSGLTTQKLEETITTALTPKYLNDPKVSIQMVTYRSVYILGEVNSPGKYEYEPDMTLPQAVATAGGYTPRASEGTATVNRKNKNEITSFEIDNNQLVNPGDVIIIERRWF